MPNHRLIFDPNEIDMDAQDALYYPEAKKEGLRVKKKKKRAPVQNVEWTGGAPKAMQDSRKRIEEGKYPLGEFE